MEWRKYKKKKDRPYVSERHSIKKWAKEIWMVNSMTWDSTFSVCILYLLTRTGKTFFRKMFFWSRVSVFVSRMVCTVKSVLQRSGMMCFSSSSFPCIVSSFFIHSLSLNSLLVLGGCCWIGSFILGWRDLKQTPSVFQIISTTKPELLLLRCSGWTFYTLEQHI